MNEIVYQWFAKTKWNNRNITNLAVKFNKEWLMNETWDNISGMFAFA